MSNRSRSYQLWAAKVENGKPVGEARQLTYGDYDVLVPAWSPDRQKIAFLGRKNGQSDLYWMDSDGSSRPERLVEGIQAMWLRWFGNTGELMVSAQWGGSSMGLWIFNPKTKNRRPFPEAVDFGGPHAMAFFDVSSDGNLLLYSREDIKGDLWLLSARSKTF
jgi:dipeptidyl aminopeptidase/acylaminoacyl peptidase